MRGIELTVDRYTSRRRAWYKNEESVGFDTVSDPTG